MNLYTNIALLFEYPEYDILDSIKDNELFYIEKKDFQEIEKLEIEYTKLFINDYPQIIAPPFASAYFGVRDKIYDYVEGFYKKAGYLIKKRDFPPDYLIYELIFLGNLKEDKNTEFEKKFLEEHFLLWFKEFKTSIVESGESKFYSKIAEKSHWLLNKRLKELKSG